MNADLTRRAARGFTLVELMVAVTGGLFVTMAVFVLSKQSTNLYQSEARVSNATLGTIVGFERLRADVERAGYLTSPNVLRDPKLCGFPDATWPASAAGAGQFMRHLSSVFIEPSATIPAEISAAGITPEEITLAGSYSSIDQFPTGPIYNDGVNDIVTLQIASPPMARLGFNPAATPSVQETLLGSVFGTGRILRVVDSVGREQYAKILKVVGSTSSPPQVVLDSVNSNRLIYRDNSPTYKCGIQGLGERSLANVVNLIRYSIRNLAGIAKYAPLYDQSAGGPESDSGRGELVREELDANGAPIVDVNGAPLMEVITEFAVDLNFALTVSQVTAPASGPPLETLAMVDDDTASKYVGQTWAAGAAAGAASPFAPQFARAIRLRLSARSREADREADLGTFGDGGTAPVMPGLYRIKVGTTARLSYARVRTMESDVVLRNHRGATWQ